MKVDKAVILVEIEKKVYQVDIENHLVINFLASYSLQNGNNINVFEAPKNIYFPEKLIK